MNRHLAQKVDEIQQVIKKIIELEYKNALNRGLLDSGKIADKIWDVLVDKNAISVPVPESAYGCYEDTDD
ncbi:MAG: hypothetical protein IPM56_19315 [Ignavibacteriales bacterium]|nr:MAG: hypothetical protein IPM56_19315 [Ignavibacteriales bacterium]